MKTSWTSSRTNWFVMLKASRMLSSKRVWLIVKMRIWRFQWIRSGNTSTQISEDNKLQWSRLIQRSFTLLFIPYSFLVALSLGPSFHHLHCVLLVLLSSSSSTISKFIHFFCCFYFFLCESWTLSPSCFVSIPFPFYLFLHTVHNFFKNGFFIR